VSEPEGPAAVPWPEVGIALREVHTDFAESAQGVATDGRQWFVVSNRAIVGLMRKITDPLSLLDPYRNTRRVGVYDLDGTKRSEVAPTEEVWAELVRLNRTWPGKQAVHLGAPTWTEGTLLVPTQRPSGVWVLSQGLSQQDWWPDPSPVRPERWSWVARDPGSGLLYTSRHWSPHALEALEWQTLSRVPRADIALGAAVPKLDRVQGGAFTDDGRVVLASSHGGGQVFCYSMPDGALLDVVDGLGLHELEGVAIQPAQVAGQEADLHLVDAGTDYWPFVRWGDFFTVRSYRLPPRPPA
jgi:hypothetical protein